MYRRSITNWDSVPVLVDAELAGRILGVTARTIRNYVRDGILEASRPTARSIRISKESLMKFGGITK